MKHELAYGPILEGLGVSPDFVPGKSAKEEQLEYFGKPGYNVSRMTEIGKEYANLEAQRNAVINKNDGRSSYQQFQIENIMKKLEDEYRQITGTFQEGPAGQYFGQEKFGQAIQDLSLIHI